MSDAAFADDTADQVDESAEDLIEEDAPEQDEEEAEEKPAKDWEKVAHDREGALAKERSRRRAEQQRARGLEERLEKLEASKSGSKSEEANLLALAEALREDDEDPITDIAALKKFAKQYAAEQRAASEQDSQTHAQQRAVQKIASQMNEAEADFADDHPDYYKAAEHLKAMRREEFEELGYSGARLNEELSNDLLGIVHRAIQSGRDPAEAVYNLAKKRGFGVDGVVKKLQTITDAQKSGRSLGAAPARTAATQLTMSSVNKLSGAAFDAAFAKLQAQEKRRGA